ncbi:hypothetical protein JYT71_00700 [Acidimicrobiaceae bacterium AH-315-P05]|nr:hypothetical protein [Acidimicrobiaceae bacterium AH-315-P05]
MNSNQSPFVVTVESAVARFDERTGATLAWIAPILVRTEAISSAELADVTDAVSSIAVAEHSPRSRRVKKPASERVADHILAIEALSHEAIRADTGGIARLATSHGHQATSRRDANGMASRLIVQRSLRNLGITRRLVLPLSAGLLADQKRYAKSLDSFRRGDDEPIVSTFVRAASVAIKNATQLAEELESARHVWNEVITGRSDSSVWPLVRYCAGHLAITSTSVADDLGISDVAAQNAIDRFGAWGIVNQNSEARRNRIWLVSDVLDAVEAFMARARPVQD